MVEDIKDFLSKKRELIRKRALAERNKKEIKEFVRNLGEKFKSGRISGVDYKQRLGDFLEGRSVDEWIDYYDKFIEACDRNLEFYEQEIKRKRVVKKIVPLVLTGMLIAGILFLIFQLGFDITGFSLEGDSGINSSSSVVSTNSVNGGNVDSNAPDSVDVGDISKDNSVSKDNVGVVGDEDAVNNPAGSNTTNNHGAGEGVGNSGERKKNNSDDVIEDDGENLTGNETSSNDGGILGVGNTSTNDSVIVNGNQTVGDILGVGNTSTNDSVIVEGNLTENNSLSNATTNVTVGNLSVANSTLLKRAKIVIGRPVKWIKKVNVNETNGSIEIGIPLDSENISVLTDNEIKLAESEIENYDKLVDEADKQDLVDGSITGLVSFDIDREKGILNRLWDWFKGLFRFGLTGRVVTEISPILNVTNESNEKVVDVTGVVGQTNAQTVAVEYYTPGPSATEKNTTSGKRLEISASDELNYTDVLAYVEIPEMYRVGEENRIRVHWNENDTNMNFSAFDNDANGYIDYVEWIVPHLSNQSFDIILITKAEHLSSNRSFISDIYDSVREQDGNFSEEILDGEYVRIVFERNLSDGRDITIWPRAISGTPKIEVHEWNKNSTLAIFNEIIDDQYNKVYLSGINGSEDTFDLRVLNGTMIFDHIIDPVVTTGEKHYVVAGDGDVDYVTGASSTWGTARDATTGTASYPTSTSINVRSSESLISTNKYTIRRGFLPFNTTGIPTDANITNVTLYFYVSEKSGTFNMDNDGDDFLVVVAGYQASESTLANSDFDQINTSTELSDRIDISSGVTAGAWNSFTLNATGISLINRTGITKLAIREGHDLLNNTIATDKVNYVTLTSFEGGENKSYLSIDYEVSGPIVTLNGPANHTFYKLGILNISLNSTYSNDFNNNSEYRIYVSNNSDDANLYKHGLVYYNSSVANGTDIVHNLTSVPYVPDADTLVLFHFDNRSEYGENDTYIVDMSGRGNNGTLIGTSNTSITSGILAGGFNFEGSDHINIPDSVSLNSTNATNSGVTVSAWIKPSTTGNSYIIASKSIGPDDSVPMNGPQPQSGFTFFIDWNDYLSYALRLHGSGYGGVCGFDYECTQDSGLTIPANVWTHVAVVSDAMSTKLYINGASGYDSNAFSSFVRNNVSLRIGTQYTVGTAQLSDFPEYSAFNGQMDEFLYINRSLTANEIKDIYRIGEGKYYWKTNATDENNRSDESELRDFVVRADDLTVFDSLSCSELANKNTLLEYGSSCTASGYTDCLSLDDNLNITSGSVLDVPASCNIIFNTTSDGQYDLYSSGLLNITGGNITASSSTNKFDFFGYRTVVSENGANGTINNANIKNGTNFSDSLIDFYDIDIDGAVILLNSTAPTSYTMTGGSLEFQYRLNATILASGSPTQGALIKAYNLSGAYIKNSTSGAGGVAWLNLSEWIDRGSGKTYQSNYSINASKSGFLDNSTTLNLTGESSTTINLPVYSTIEISTTETLADVYTRLNDVTIFTNESSGSNPCKYVASASINVTSSGVLVMDGCTLLFNSSFPDNKRKFEIGGELRANYSNITRRGDQNYYFYTSTNANFTLKNSYVSWAGDSDTDNRRGLTLHTNRVEFINNTLRRNFGLVTRANNLTFSQLDMTTIATYNIQNYANNTLVIDSNLSGATTGDVRVLSGNITLLNTNYTKYWVADGGNLYRKWYVNVHIQDGSDTSSINNANVSFYNNTGDLVYNFLTNSSGDIVRQNVTEYRANATSKYYQTNYTINVSASGYNDVSRSVNITSSQDLTFNMAANNNAPEIIYVIGNNAFTEPSEGGVAEFSYNITIKDLDGFSDLNFSDVSMRFQRDGEPTRQNLSCVNTANYSLYFANFTCTVGMQYFDESGVWTVNVTASDTYPKSVENSSNTFVYGSLVAVQISPKTLAWAQLFPGDVNSLSTSNPMVLNNTGNYNASINVTAYDLYGVTDSSKIIPAANFSVNTVDACEGYTLSNSTNVSIPDASLVRGNVSLNYGNESSGQEELYVCLEGVPAGLDNQDYSTSSGNNWIIRIFVAVFVSGGGKRRKRRKKKSKKSDVIEGESEEESLNLAFNKTGRCGEVDLGVLLKGIRVDARELLKRLGGSLGGECVMIPLDIFKENVGAAEILSKYLKENKNIKFEGIAKLLGRDARTIWVNYHNSLKKMKGTIKVEGGSTVPISVFHDRRLSILESIVYYLKERGYKNIEISKMIGKDSRNIFTFYSRAKKKLTR